MDFANIREILFHRLGGACGYRRPVQTAACRLSGGRQAIAAKKRRRRGRRSTAAVPFVMKRGNRGRLHKHKQYCRGNLMPPYDHASSAKRNLYEGALECKEYSWRQVEELHI